jgi:hypothetical protein
MIWKKRENKKRGEGQMCDPSRRLEHEPSQGFGIGETPIPCLVTDP